MSVAALASEAERVLRAIGNVQVRFDADEAVQELVRLGLAELVPAPSSASGGSSREAGDDVLARAVPARHGARMVQNHWDALLWVRVDAILREFGSLRLELGSQPTMRHEGEGEISGCLQCTVA
eukprot:288160-Chlamydomonas_euryale.AAC.5